MYAKDLEFRISENKKEPMALFFIQSKKIFQKCYILLKIKHIKSDAKKYNKKYKQNKEKKR